jgi:glucokinase
MEETGAALAAGLSNAILTLNPDTVLLVGGVSRAGTLLLGPIRRALAAEPFQTPFKRVSIRIARNPQCGCVGAALMALERGG